MGFSPSGWCFASEGRGVGNLSWPRRGLIQYDYKQTNQCNEGYRLFGGFKTQIITVILYPHTELYVVIFATGMFALFPYPLGTKDVKPE
jgi:hypothetical protein